jgi:penicillin-binding protein 2
MKFDYNKNGDPFVVKEKKYSFGNLKDSYYHLGWMEDSFLFGENDKEVLKKTFDLEKNRNIIIILLLSFFILFIRLFWLQVIKGDDYRLLAEGNRIKVENIEPKRGIIYSSNMTPLVKNEANFVLYLIPIDLPKDEVERDEIIRKLSNILSGIENSTLSGETDLQITTDSPYFSEIKSKLDKIEYGSLDSYQPLFLMDNIDYNSAMIVYLAAEEMPGVSISVKMRRKYLSSEENSLSLSHFLGYIGKISEDDLEVFGTEYSLIDYIGKSGLEYFYENELKGVKGKKNIEVDAFGREKKVVSQTNPEDGHSLVLSIDIDLQKKSEEILKKYLDENNMARASIVALNPNNGEIKTLISWPSYNNNIFSKGISQTDYDNLTNNPNKPLFNRAVSGSFSSGSTLKPTLAAAALQEKIITVNTTVMSTGGINVGAWFFPDWKAGGHGLTDVRKAIAESVNTFFYYIGAGYNDFKGLGIEKIDEYLALFGLGQQSGIDLAQEGKGFIPTPEWKKETQGETWYIGNTYNVSIGQGDILVTPLQVANFTAFFANSGKLYRPHLVKQILESEQKVLRDVEPEIIRQNFIDPENVQIVKEGMRQTIVSGSARRLNSLPVEVAGKTGTAQWGTNKTNHAWFTSFAPYNNPEIVLTVMVEEGIEGSGIATSIAGEILNWYFTKDQIIATTTIDNTNTNEIN